MPITIMDMIILWKTYYLKLHHKNIEHMMIKNNQNMMEWMTCIIFILRILMNPWGIKRFWWTTQPLCNWSSLWIPRARNLPFTLYVGCSWFHWYSFQHLSSIVIQSTLYWLEKTIQCTIKVLIMNPIHIFLRYSDILFWRAL